MTRLLLREDSYRALGHRPENKEQGRASPVKKICGSFPCKIACGSAWGGWSAV